MNKKADNAIKSLKSVQLPEVERAEVRAFLKEYAEANQSVRSPWAAVLSPLQNMARSAVVAAAMLLLIGGITAAAEEALPGEPLYAVKVNVNETVMGLTSITSASEAENQSRIAARRISELETLAARGLLDSNVSDSLTQAISEHTESARQHIAAVSERGEAGNAASLETELLSILNTHSDILEDLATAPSGEYASTTAAAAEKLRDLARAKAENDVVTAVDNVNSLPVRVDKDIHLSPQQTDELLKQTAARLKRAQTEFTNSYGTFSNTDIRDGIEGLLIASAEKVNTAVDYIDAEEYEAAQSPLRESLTYAHEVVILLNARHLLENSAGITIERLLNGGVSSTTTATTSIDISDAIKTDGLATTTEVTGTTSSTTASTTASSSATTSMATSSSSTKNFIRQQIANTEAHRRIEAVLERINETLSVSEPQSRAGILPSRSSSSSSIQEKASE